MNGRNFQWDHQYTLFECQRIERDVTTAILAFYNNGMAAMLVYLDNPVGVEFCSYVKTFFSSNKLYSIDADHVSENVL